MAIGYSRLAMIVAVFYSIVFLLLLKHSPTMLPVAAPDNVRSG
jgi:hypothetical protein